MIRRIVAALLVAAFFMSVSADAQQTTPAAPSTTSIPVAAVDSLPAFAALNGALLRAGTLVYRLQLQRDTLVTALGTRTVAVTETTLNGVPTWLVVESRTGTAVETLDSLYLTRADLSPERWVAASGRTQLAASFTRDTMFAAMQTYQGRSSFAVPIPAGVLLTPAMLDRVVELLPLQEGFHTGASLMLLELGASRTQPLVLTVERSESCALPDRSGDCWVVLAHSSSVDERLWVTKLAPRVVKTAQATTMGLLSSVLTSETLPVVTSTTPAGPAIPTALYPPRCPPPCTP